MKSLPEARIKRTRAVELAAQGMSYDEIADAVGYSHRGSAHRAVFKAIAENEAEDVELFQAIEMDRLDHYLTKVWSKVEEGDLKAISVALRISDARIGLLGLDRRTAPHEGPRALVLGGPAGCWRQGNPRRATECASEPVSLACGNVA
jgi:hypothetical protein